MSQWFNSSLKVKKTVVVTWYGKNYVTATGFTKHLADLAASRIMERFRDILGKKYGVPYYSDPKGLKKWKENLSRLRKKYYRRALPLIEKLFV